MTSTTWTAGNGNFNTAGNWSSGVPTLGVDAFINGTSAAPLTVSYTAGTDTANSLTTTYTTFAMSGGSLTLSFGSSLSQQSATLNAFTQSAGTLDFQNGGSANNTSTINGVGGGIAQTGGTLKVDAGLLQIYGASSFAGTLSGAGAIALRGTATFTFNASVAVTVGTLYLDDSATMALGGNLSYAGTFADQTFNTANTINLDGFKLSLSGPAFFTDGNGYNVVVNGAGTLALAGTTQISAMILGASAALTNSGTVNQTGYFQLGDGNTDATSVTNTGTWSLTIGQTLGVGANGASSFTNSGLFNLSGNGGSASVTAAFANSASGTISVAASDTLQFYGTTSSAGTLSGAGAIALRGSSTFTLNAATAISVATLDVFDSSTLLLGTNLTYAGIFADQTFNLATNVNLNGHTLTLTGTSYFTDGNGSNVAVNGPGTLSLSGTTQIVELQTGGAAVLNNSGTVNQTGYFQVGDGTGNISSATNTGTWNVSAPVTIGTGTNSSSNFTNAGLFEMTSTGGSSVVNAVFTNAAAGTLSVATGDLLLFHNVTTLSGTVTGAGTVDVYNGGTLTIGAGAVLGVANFGFSSYGTIALAESLTYAGSFFDQTFNTTTTLNLGGNSFTLTGPAYFTDGNGANVAVNGPGTLTLAGTTQILELQTGGSAALDNKGTVNQTGYFQIGDGSGQIASVVNTGTWDLSAAVAIATGTNSASTFTNSGLFEQTSTSGASSVSGIFTSSGTVDAVNAGSIINFVDGGTFGGTLSGAGAINFTGGHASALTSHITLSVAQLGLSGSGTVVTDSITNVGYAGIFTIGAGAAFTLNPTIKFTLTGTGSLNGTINGAGDFIVSGKTANVTTNGLVLGGSAILAEQKGAVMAQSAQWTIGDGASSTAQLQVGAGSIYEITADVGISSNGVGAITNGGTFEKNAGTGTSVITPLVTNAGLVSAASGTLDFAQQFTNDGTVTAAGGSLVDFGSSVINITGDKGVIDLANGGNAYFAGYVEAAQTLDFKDSSVNEATIHAPGSFSATIAGFSGSNRLDLQGITNVVGTYTGTTTAGTLTLTETIGGSPVVVASLAFAGDFTLASFTIGNDGAGGTLIQDATPHTPAPPTTDLSPHPSPTQWDAPMPFHASGP